VAEIQRRYHEHFDELKHGVAHLDALATEAIAAGTEAFLDADLAAADRVISADMFIDDLTHGLEQKSYEILARQQPMASDLRAIVTVLRTVHEIERSGDLMLNVARATRRLYPAELPARVRGIIARMGTQAALQLRVAVEAFASEDAARALALPDMDDVMDDLERELFRAIFSSCSNDEAGVHQAVQISLVGRYYERIADHAVNVGQRVAYMVTGEFPPTESMGDVALG